MDVRTKIPSCIDMSTAPYLAKCSVNYVFAFSLSISQQMILNTVEYSIVTYIIAFIRCLNIQQKLKFKI